jgi:hypothetical protein
MRRRVRWENVIRVAVAALLVAMVVAWPLLAPPEPRLPGTAATPLVERDDEPQVPGDETRGGADRQRIGRGGDDGRAEPGEGDPPLVERRHEAQRRRRRAERHDEAERRERGRRRAERHDEAERRERGRRRAERHDEAERRERGRRRAERHDKAERPSRPVAPPPPLSADPPEPVGTAVPSPPDDPAAAEFGFEGR